MSKGKYIFHSINSIRSRPDDNPQSKNRTIFEQTFTEASEGVGLMDSSASSDTKYLNQPWKCSLTSHQNLVAAHPSVRGKASPDLLPKFIAASDDLARAGPGPHRAHAFICLAHPALGVLQNILPQTTQNVWLQISTTDQMVPSYHKKHFLRFC